MVDPASDVALQSNGKIVLVGQAGATFRRGPDFAAVRCRPDGTLDPHFSDDGRVRTEFQGDEDWARGVAIQADGTIVSVGYAYTEGSSDFAATRDGRGGRLDRAFGNEGRVRTRFGDAAGDDYAFDAAVQPDGKIVAAGWATPISGEGYDVGVGRYLVS